MARFSLDFNAAIGSAMKRMLMVNDSYGGSKKVMREITLDEFNNLLRYLERRMEDLKAECLPTPSSSPISGNAPNA